MKYYIQFMRAGIGSETGQMVEPCGSDSVFILDGRNNLDTMINDGFERMRKLENVQNFAGFQVMKGNFKSAVSMYKTY